MDIHNWIMDIHNWIMNIHNWIMDIHNWIMDIHIQLWISIIELWISIIEYGSTIELWISIITGFMRFWLSILHCRIFISICIIVYRADSRLAPSQWEASLQSNAVCHWLGANLGSAPVYDKRTFNFHEDKRQVSAPPQCWKIIENPDMFLCFQK